MEDLIQAMPADWLPLSEEKIPLDGNVMGQVFILLVLQLKVELQRCLCLCWCI